MLQKPRGTLTHLCWIGVAMWPKPPVPTSSFIKDGTIHTPTPDCFLNGITRQTVMGLAREKGYEVIERTIMPEELGTFTECFITGTAAEVTPVKEIAGIHYKPGDISEDLVTTYEALVRGKTA
jgi:branched-chain amino acid aminotransferase